MKLSLSGFLFEDDYKTQSLSFEDFVNFARKTGYEGVEIRNTQINLHTSKDAILKYKSILNDNGLCVTCMTPRGLPVEIQERNDLFARYLDLAVIIDCRLLKISGSIKKDWLCQAAQLAGEYSIELGLNNHINSVTETISGTKILLQDVDQSNFGILFDPMHLSLSNEDYIGAIDVFYSKIFNVLVQCVRQAGKDEKPVITHAGKEYVKTCIDENPLQNWPAIVEKLKQHGYDGWITVVENAWPCNQRKDIAARTAAYLRNIWA